MNRFSRIALTVVSVTAAVFLAWRIGLWLEPEKGGVPDVPIRRPTEAAFATGTVKEGLQFELRGVKVADNGKEVEGIGIIRYSIPQEDVRPAAVAMAGTLKAKIPHAEKIIIVLRPAVDCLACNIGGITWEKGRAEVRYGIPSLAQIEEWNAKIGKEDDRPRLHVVDRETFSTGLAVIMAMNAIKAEKPIEDEGRLLDGAAAQTGVPYPRAKEAVAFMGAYYTGNRYGSEKFDLPLP